MRFAALAAVSLLLVGVPAADARPGFKRCQSVREITRLEIGPKQRPCDTARNVARHWRDKRGCNPTGRAVRGCKLKLKRPWGCEANADDFDPDSPEPYYIQCTRDFWHPMSGDPITAMVVFYR